MTTIDGLTNKTLTVPVGAYPGMVAVNQITHKAYVLNLMGNDVTVITGGRFTSTVSTGTYPNKISINSQTNKFMCPARSLSRSRSSMARPTQS